MKQLLLTLPAKSFFLVALLFVSLAVSPAATPGGSEGSPSAQQEGSKPKGDVTAPSDGLKFIFDKKDHDDLVKKLKDYLDPLEAREDAKTREGTESDKYKTANAKVKKGEAELRSFLKGRSMKYKIDSECLAAVMDWQTALSEYLAIKGDFKKGNISVGSEQTNGLREEPKNTFTRRIPKNYDPAKKAWPLLLIVQDKGKQSKQVTLDDLKSTLLLEGEGDIQGHITLAIDVPENCWDDQAKLHAAILKPLREIRTLLRIDTRKIAIGGIGAGVRAAASAMMRYPFAFSAFVAKGGDMGGIKPENFYNLPIFAFGDAKLDEEVDLEGGKKAKWIDRAKEVGVDVTMKADAKGDDIARWLSKITRNPYSPRVISTLKTDRRFRNAVWLSFDPDPAKEAEIDASVDRATNTITVKCNGVSRYYLFLSDALVDLTKPVIIKTNDQERKESLPPTLETLLNCYFEDYTGVDKGGIFTSRPRPIDVPRKKAAPLPESKPAGG